MKAKFQVEKAPGDYEGRCGAVLQHLPASSEYQVQFDGDARGPGWLSSHMLDRAAASERVVVTGH